ncbi:MAG: tRNA (5-methylaminomethyl-2-thiouridine)(34)-methyltransferase MnmD [Bacteroidales bacterium]|nr:tRNA (5-methylaminomethyl-2-thiouridine)(34)-methyltransferase MnmD [Bacteroidales bacterium]
MVEPKLIVTNDGSHTLYSLGLDEIYHSKNGAVTESLHVFVKNGLRKVANAQVKIFEVGFGTGLNAFLTWKHKKPAQQIEYTGIETHPVKEEIFVQLNYAGNPVDKLLFNQLHMAEWGKSVEIVTGFKLRKIQQSIENYVFDDKYDLVYFDAFAPGKQPEMWTSSIFANLYAAMSPNGILATYTSKGDVRRNLLLVGFKVEKVPGPPGKREMLVAYKML